MSLRVSIKTPEGEVFHLPDILPDEERFLAIWEPNGGMITAACDIADQFGTIHRTKSDDTTHTPVTLVRGMGSIYNEKVAALLYPGGGKKGLLTVRFSVEDDVEGGVFPIDPTLKEAIQGVYS